MGDNNKHVKSVKNFDFNKSKEKRFDFTKDDKPVRTKNRLLWGFCVILVIMVAALFLFLKKTSSREEILDVATGEIVAQSVLTSDNITESIDSTKQDDIVVENTVVDKSKVEPTQVQNVSSSVKMSTENVEQMAWSVIRGNYDNNPIRRQKLGEDYQVIQDKVNEFYRKGLVH